MAAIAAADSCSARGEHGRPGGEGRDLAPAGVQAPEAERYAGLTTSRGFSSTNRVSIMRSVLSRPSGIASPGLPYIRRAMKTRRHFCPTPLSRGGQKEDGDFGA
jgi:hypothetical protein